MRAHTVVYGWVGLFKISMVHAREVILWRLLSSVIIRIVALIIESGEERIEHEGGGPQPVPGCDSEGPRECRRACEA
eukprot:4327080-Prorocentrum_lima.AAC.1